MAQEKGLYRDAGLDVDIREGHKNIIATEELSQGKVNYAVLDSSALLARGNGTPIKALAAIFQHSPLALMVKEKSAIRSLRDLKNKRVMLAPGLNSDILAALAIAGITTDDFIRQDISYDIHSLLDEKTDAYAVYTTDQPHQLDRLGIPYRIFHPKDQGVNFYGDILVTSEDEISQHPNRVKLFTEATILGWEYALSHIDETIKLIQKKYNTQNLSYEQLKFEADETKTMVLNDLVVHIGYMNEHRWQAIADIYKDQGLLEKKFIPSDFIHQPKSGLSEMIQLYRWHIMIFTLLIIFFALIIHNFHLRRAVKAQTYKIRKREEQFSLAIRGASDGLWDWNIETNKVFYSPRWKSMLGYEEDELEHDINTWKGLIHPDDNNRVLDLLHHYLEGSATSFEVEMKMRHKDGHTVHILSRASLSRDGATGKAQRLVGTHVDISDRIDSENLTKGTNNILEMIASDRDKQDIFKHIVTLFESRNPDMRASILMLEKGHLQIGYAASLPDEYNKKIKGLAIGPNVGSCGAAAYTHRRVIVEDISTSPLWAPFKALALAHNLKSCWSEPILSAKGEVLGTFAMYHDHPAKPNQRALDDISSAAALSAIVIARDINSASLRKLSSSVEQAAEVIIITNTDGIIEYVNPAFTKVTGYSKEEGIGQTPRMLQSGEHSLGFYKDMWSEIIHNNGWRGKIIDKKKDGTLYPAMTSISPVRNEQGIVTHFVGVHEDLSDFQIMEEQLQQAQKLEAIGTLSAGIAHDFNNTLASIIGNLHIAAVGHEEDSLLMNRLKKVESMAYKASETISQLLTYSNKGVTVELKLLPICSFIKSSLMLYKTIFHKNISLIISPDCSGLIISANLNQLQQVMMNMLSNAMHAVADVKVPEITITLGKFDATEAFEKKYPGIKEREFAHLSISDNGSGITEENLKHIFDPFFTTKEVGEGVGLGLSMVFGAVQSHHGIINVESTPGAGTTFHLYFPIRASSLYIESRKKHSNLKINEQSQTIQ